MPYDTFEPTYFVACGPHGRLTPGVPKPDERVYGPFNWYGGARRWLLDHCGGSSGNEPCENGHIWGDHRIAEFIAVPDGLRRT